MSSSFSISKTDNDKYIVSVSSTDESRSFDNVQRYEAKTYSFNSLQEVFDFADEWFPSGD